MEKLRPGFVQDINDVALKNSDENLKCKAGDTVPGDKHSSVVNIPDDIPPLNNCSQDDAYSCR